MRRVLITRILLFWKLVILEKVLQGLGIVVGRFRGMDDAYIVIQGIYV